MRNRIIELIDQAAKADPKLLFLTGDLGFSVVEPLQEHMGERFINMGISEANMMSVASSLAACGHKVFTYSIAPFVTARCFEQIRNDVCYQQRPIKIIGVGAGYSYGTMGPSHHALEDAHIMSALPDMVIGSPANKAELDRFFALTLSVAAPVYFRIPRESGSARSVPEFGLASGAYLVRRGQDVNLVASGVAVEEAAAAAILLETKGISANLISVPVLKPFPTETLNGLLVSGPVISIFEGYPANPLSVGVMQMLCGNINRHSFFDFSVPHGFSHQVGNTDHLRQIARLDGEGIAARVNDILAAGRLA